MDSITKDTAQKIDFLIKGVEDGKFDDAVKKIEFMKTLSGDFGTPTYIQSLLERIDRLEEERHSMTEEINTLRADFITHQSNVNNDMNRIAKAVQYFMKPDPLATEVHDIEQFIIEKGARKY